MLMLPWLTKSRPKNSHSAIHLRIIDYKSAVVRNDTVSLTDSVAACNHQARSVKGSASHDIQSRIQSKMKGSPHIRHCGLDRRAAVAVQRPVKNIKLHASGKAIEENAALRVDDSLPRY